MTPKLRRLLIPCSAGIERANGDRLGDKLRLETVIHEVTGIAKNALRGDPLPKFSIEERISWASQRSTKRDEDGAYSLLGIFDVSMPLIYGEGREKAFKRLQKEIEESSKGGSIRIYHKMVPMLT